MNTIGSYRCDCLAGFKKVNEADKVCIDVDECKEVHGLCAQRCINFWGSYRCGCDTGYQLNVNNRTCDDIDECEVHKSYDLCMGVCENTPGSFRCACPEGYKLAGDNRSCQGTLEESLYFFLYVDHLNFSDIDECESRQVCTGHSEICTNVRGSYRCTQISCPSEYIKDPEKKK